MLVSMIIDVPEGISATQLILYSLFISLNGMEGETRVPIDEYSFAVPTPLKHSSR
jgi:hypothetical protein